MVASKSYYVYINDNNPHLALNPVNATGSAIERHLYARVSQ